MPSKSIPATLKKLMYVEYVFMFYFSFCWKNIQFHDFPFDKAAFIDHTGRFDDLISIDKTNISIDYIDIIYL